MDSRFWIQPPGGFLSTWNGLRVNLTVVVTEPELGKTQVTVSAHYEAFENNVQHAWLVCQSNGGLENRLLMRLAQKIPATP